MHLKSIPIFTVALFYLINVSYAGPIYSVTTVSVTEITVPAKRAMTILTFVQPRVDPNSPRARMVVDKDGVSVAVRLANDYGLVSQADEVFSGQVVIAGPAKVSVIGPTTFLTYRLQSN